MASQPSRFIWYELITSDVNAAAAFYGAVVGWNADQSHVSSIDYRMWSTGEAMIGGLIAIPAEAKAGGMRPIWVGYINVPDVDATVAAIVAVGGAVRMSAVDIEMVGRMAMVTDPQGAAFYVMTPLGEGESTAFLPGKPGHGGWNELHATHLNHAVAFYAAQFGWGKADAVDMGAMGVYQLFHTQAGPEAVGGMMEDPNAAHPYWLYYFNVADINDAKSRLEAAGGTVLHGPVQVPGGSWIINATDPQGALFALVAPGAAG